MIKKEQFDEWIPCWKCRLLLFCGVFLLPTRWGTTFEDSAFYRHVRRVHDN